MKNKIKAFTLVELMIVIIVLSILSTTGYVFYGTYKETARDTIRKANLIELNNALKYYYSDNSEYPTPNNYLTGDTEEFKDEYGNFWGFGVFGSGLAENIKELKRVPVDPKSGEYYEYDLMIDEEGFRLKTNFEKTEEEFVLPEKLTKGIIDGPYENTNYKFRYVKRSDNWSKKDPNCSLPDIEVVDTSGNILQTWAGCNSTLGYGLEWGKEEDGSDSTISDTGNYGLDGASTFDASLFDSVNNKASMMYSGANAKNLSDIILLNGINKWYDSEYNTIWGKLYNWGQAIKVGNACPVGWHLPTDAELFSLLNYLGCNESYTFNNSYCNGIGWKEHNLTDEIPQTNLVSLLKIPLSGKKDTSANSFKERGNSAYLWTSTIDGTNVHNYGFIYSEDYIRLSSTEKKGDYLSVRCIKNN